MRQSIAAFQVRKIQQLPVGDRRLEPDIPEPALNEQQQIRALPPILGFNGRLQFLFPSLPDFLFDIGILLERREPLGQNRRHVRRLRQLTRGPKVNQDWLRVLSLPRQQIDGAGDVGVDERLARMRGHVRLVQRGRVEDRVGEGLGEPVRVDVHEQHLAVCERQRGSYDQRQLMHLAFDAILDTQHEKKRQDEQPDRVANDVVAQQSRRDYAGCELTARDLDCDEQRAECEHQERQRRRRCGLQKGVGAGHAEPQNGPFAL